MSGHQEFVGRENTGGLEGVGEVPVLQIRRFIGVRYVMFKPDVYVTFKNFNGGTIHVK